jgi:hypothetical protein
MPGFGNSRFDAAAVINHATIGGDKCLFEIRPRRPCGMASVILCPYMIAADKADQKIIRTISCRVSFVGS